MHSTIDLYKKLNQFCIKNLANKNKIKFKN